MPKSQIPKKSSGSFSKLLLPLVIIILVVIGLFGGYVYVSKSGILSNSVISLPKITKPSPDMSRARQLTVKPDEDTIMQIETKEKITISLLIPKGALDKQQVIKMIPYYYSSKTKDPSVGVIVSPGTLTFKMPVTLFFDLTESVFKTDAPEILGTTQEARLTGTSQILMLDKDAKELIPMLIARDLETSTQLRARVLTGGGYVVSFDGQDQKKWAENALSKDKMNALSILESGNVLLSTGAKLDKKTRSKIGAAANKVLANKDIQAQEYYAALVTQKLLKDSKTSLIQQAYATETSLGVIDYECKLKNFTVTTYLGFAMAAKIKGNNAGYEHCMTMARNQSADDARRELANKNVSIKTLLIALKNLQFLGVDDKTDLGTQLHERIKDIARKEASKVAYDIDATQLQRAVELQKLQALGAHGTVEDLLHDQIVEEYEKTGELALPPPADFDEESDYTEEAILYEQAMSILGIELLKQMGITEFDEESLKEKFKGMTENAQMLNEAAYSMCKELGGDDCDSVYNQAKHDLEDALDEGYRVAGEIGTVQGGDYEEPDYEDSHGSFYYEDDLTPTPEEESSEEWGYEDPADEYEDNHDQGDVVEEESGLETQSTQPQEEDYGFVEEAAEEEVEGASTSNPVNIVIKSISKFFRSF